jgi:hypothetical protein
VRKAALNIVEEPVKIPPLKPFVLVWRLVPIIVVLLLGVLSEHYLISTDCVVELDPFFLPCHCVAKDVKNRLKDGFSTIYGNLSSRRGEAIKDIHIGVHIIRFIQV